MGPPILYAPPKSARTGTVAGRVGAIAGAGTTGAGAGAANSGSGGAFGHHWKAANSVVTVAGQQ